MAEAESRIGPAGGFYYHLFRASDLLEEGKAAEASDELEQALALQPDNREALALLAAALYKQERHEEAINAYRQLIEANPEEATLRVNLALVLIKADELDAAEFELQKALEFGGESKRLHGYLGLVYSKKNEYEKALIAFNKAGSSKMVAEMEELIRRRQKGLSAPEAAPNAASDGVKIEDEKSVESAVVRNVNAAVEQSQSQAIDAAQRRRRLLRIAPETPTESAGAEGEPAPRAGAAVGPVRVPLVREGAGALRLESPCLLRVRPGSGVIADLSDVALQQGEIEAEALNKRFKGKSTKSTFGSPESPLCRVDGSGVLLLRPTRRRLSLFEVGPGDKAFLLESALYAFTTTLTWENGRIGTSETGIVDLVTLHGEGVFVLATEGEIAEVRIEDAEFLVSAQRLVGWLGKLLPRVIAPPDGPMARHAPLIRFKGSGRLILAGVE